MVCGFSPSICASIISAQVTCAFLPRNTLPQLQQAFFLSLPVDGAERQIRAALLK
jgi:hypothetical protein